MDEVYQRAAELERGLSQFNERLQAAFSRVVLSHQGVSPLWQDAMRREYDQVWKPLEEEMLTYNRSIGPKYVDLIIERLRHLRSYLYGS